MTTQAMKQLAAAATEATGAPWLTTEAVFGKDEFPPGICTNTEGYFAHVCERAGRFNAEVIDNADPNQLDIYTGPCFDTPAEAVADFAGWRARHDAALNAFERRIRRI